MTVLSQTRIQTPYLSYSYSYPHKTAYRPLSAPISIRDAWKNESISSLFLYMHIPFCEMRCGFCNLFTMTNASSDLESAYLDALARQANAVNEELTAIGTGASSNGVSSNGASSIGVSSIGTGSIGAKNIASSISAPRFARVAIGGGTPTFLSTDHLSTLLGIAESVFSVDFKKVPCSIETSPLTSESDKLEMLKQRGISRVSIGIQSFIDSEVKAVGRSQTSQQVHSALERIKSNQFPVLNIDLIYGIPEQTTESWLYSLIEAVKYQPEEIYLYPLYVRPLTGLARQQSSNVQENFPENDHRLGLYRVGREFLLANGYEQCSMRMFRLAKNANDAGPVYCCQTDGMVGIGCGSRSYTKTLHYSDQYAVTAKPIKNLIEEFAARDADSFRVASHGIELNIDEQKRRLVIQSLLQTEGLDFEMYRRRFGCDALSDFEDLSLYLREGYFEFQQNRMVITPSGLELSDSLGVKLYSSTVQHRMSEYQLR